MKKKPFVTKEQLDEIIKKYPTPFHLYDEKGIRKNMQALKEAFAWNPGYKEYFAVKATPNPFLIDILREYGCGCDCSSYTELGRFMLGPYGCLVTKAIHEKHTHKEYIGVDACAVNLMRPAMYGAYHHITVMGKEDTPCDHKYDVTGSLCENNDKFAIDRMLPKIDMGDVLVIHDTGAHGFSMGYNYNGKLKSAEVLLKEDGSTQLIRRAETPADYFATFDCFDIGKKLIK